MDGAVLYVKGTFYSINGTNKAQLAAIDTASVFPSAFSADLNDSQSASYMLNSLSVDNGKLYVCGGFQYIQGKQRNNIARINLSTGLVDDWNANNGINTNNYIYTLNVTGNKLVIRVHLTSLKHHLFILSICLMQKEILFCRIR